MLLEPVYQVEQASTEEDIQAALKIRFEVFVAEQGVSPEAEADEYDAIDPHWLVKDEHGIPIATARITNKGNGLGKVERVAVLRPYRSQGIGRILLQQIEADAKHMGYQKLMLHGQVQGRGFYEKLGYDAPSETLFEEEGIQHILMEKAL